MISELAAAFFNVPEAATNGRKPTSIAGNQGRALLFEGKCSATALLYRPHVGMHCPCPENPLDLHP